MIRVAVIGAGAVGLSTAVNVIETIPNVKVTVIADKFNEETTSDGAAGIFTPIHVHTTDPHVAREWISDSWQHYRKLAESEDAPLAGISCVTGFYVFKEKAPELPEFRDFCYDFRQMNQTELSSIGDGKHKCGWKVTSLMVEGRWYLPWLMARFEKLGGKMIKKTLKDISEIRADYDFIMNCSGLGSRTLFNDTAIYPVRGQIMRVKAPWIKHFYRDLENNAYILPGKEHVVIGGTMDRNDHSEEVSVDTREELMRKCCRLLPSLKHASIEREWVGFRPWREPIRLEMEEILTDKGRIKIIHNYGHGHVGIGLSWGSAKAATKLLQTALSAHARVAKL